MKNRFKWLARVILGLGVCVALYFLAAFAGGKIVLNKARTAPAQGIPIYLVNNGVHIDVVVPVSADCACDPLHAPSLDVLRQPFDSQMPPARWHWVALGWGDREFMLGVPTWGDLTPYVALKAISGLDNSVIRLSSERGEPASGANAVRLLTRPQEYRALLDYILKSAATPRELAARPAEPENRFYLSDDHYNLFNTCNEWLRRGLAQAGIRTPLWSPFPGAILKVAGE